MNTRLTFGLTWTAILLATTASAEDAWDWKFELYALAPSITGDAGIGRLTDAGVNVDPVDIIEVLDLGAMVYGEGMHRSGWGFSLDYSFMDLSDRGSFALGAGRADARVFQGTLTALAYRRILDAPDQLLDLYAGLRWWQVRLDVDAALGPVARSANVRENWVDPHLGARYRQQFNDSDWSWFALADIGGFGLASDFAWTAEAGVAWQATETFSLELSYKWTGVDYDTGTESSPDFFAYDTITQGPKIGFVFEF